MFSSFKNLHNKTINTIEENKNENKSSKFKQKMKAGPTPRLKVHNLSPLGKEKTRIIVPLQEHVANLSPS